MKLAPPRLLPIVIAAAAALLLFKGLGIVTQGGYSLVGTTEAVAAGGASGAGAGGGEAGGAGGADMTDLSPTLEDDSVTMELPSRNAAAAGGGHGASPEIGPADNATVLDDCVPGEVEPAGEAHGGDSSASLLGPCVPDPGVNEHGDALPLIKDNATGELVPLAQTIEDASSQNAINERLSERRTELDAREKELDMRATLIEAAEKRIEERSAELKALEERINKLVDDNKTAERQQFVSLVAMYENMKPKDAATIFNQLDMPVLLGVAKAMNPRKMAPILARMDPLKAKALTDGIAADEVPAPVTTEAVAEDLTNLPQIVGQ